MLTIKMNSNTALNTIITIFYLTSNVLLTQGDQDLVSKACNRTTYIDLCVSSLRSDPRSSTASEVKELAEIALNVSIANGIETLTYIKELRSSGGGGRCGLCLRDCLEEYEDAVASLEDSVHQLRIRGFKKVNVLVSAAMTGSDTCEDGFVEVSSSGGVSPLTQRNQLFYRLCSNFLAISRLLF